MFAITHPGELPVSVDGVFRVSASQPELDPILLNIPLQLLAYHVALAQGANVDQPRNLAKSLTVESCQRECADSLARRVREPSA